MNQPKGTQSPQLRRALFTFLCLCSLLAPLQGQPPPDLDLTEELIKLLLKDHPKVLANRKLIDELKADAPEARLAERDHHCVEIELKLAKAEERKLKTESAALERDFDRAQKQLEEVLPESEALSVRSKAARGEAEASKDLRRRRVVLVKKLKRNGDYLQLQDAYWNQFLIKAHNVHLDRARKNIKESDFGKSKLMTSGVPEKALAEIEKFEEAFCRKDKTYAKLEQAFATAHSELVAADAALLDSLAGQEKVVALNAEVIKFAKDLAENEHRSRANAELIERLEDQMDELKPGADAMAKLRKKTIKGCFGDEKLAERLIGHIVGDHTNPGGLVIR